MEESLGDAFGNLFGGAPGPSGPKSFVNKEEKGVPWNAKVIDGKYFVPLSEVGELLKVNDVLPKVRAGIERRVKKGPPRGNHQG